MASSAPAAENFTCDDEVPKVNWYQVSECVADVGAMCVLTLLVLAGTFNHFGSCAQHAYGRVSRILPKYRHNLPRIGS